MKGAEGLLAAHPEPHRPYIERGFNATEPKINDFSKLGRKVVPTAQRQPSAQREVWKSTGRLE